MNSQPLLPAFLKLAGRPVLLVGGGQVAAAKLEALVQAGAQVTVVALAVRPELRREGVRIVQRAFVESDLDGVWFCVSAATPEVNRQVALASETRRVFLNAADDPGAASVYLGGVVRKAGVTVAISTEGAAPALSGLLREAFEQLLPDELPRWSEVARSARARWKASAVPMHKRRPLLLDALNGLYRDSVPAMPEGGFVSLVGAGPGDPGLLTLRGRARLEEADLVLYDALASAEVLALATRAHCFFVGKRAGRKAIQQETIQKLLVRSARRGQKVVRLKGGDPFVLGRGGEEALALVEAGVPFEVVPGVSSAISAPALAGIPVTHRGIASGFCVLPGHSDPLFRSLVGGLSPNALTLVVLMGLSARASIAIRLLERGWRRDTPVALLLGASTKAARTWLGTLETLVTQPLPDGEDAPGTLCIGDVVRLAEALSRGEVPRAVHGEP